MKRQVVLVMGPTAVGKTDVAMALQDLLGGPQRTQLISADSAMIYRGMDIGSAKPSADELSHHPHALIDIRAPQDPYTVADFVADADRCVVEAFAREQLPIIVGGTMLYLSRFVQGIAQLPAADATLRAELKDRYESLGGAALHAELSVIDPQAAANIHPNNPQRLLRALEVVHLTGQPLSHQWQELGGPAAVERLHAEIVSAAIVPDDRKALHERIERRFDAMLAAGFMAELNTLYRQPGLHKDLPAMRAVGYRQGFAFLAGELDAAGFRADAITATRRLAKRQLTWLRSWPDIETMQWGEANTLAKQIAARL